MTTHPTSHFARATAALALALLTGGCSPTLPEPRGAASPPVVTPAAEVSDADVTNHVTTALLSDGVLKAYPITVVTLNGDVRLTGTVNTQAQADSALEIARGAAGAHSLHNELVVTP